MRLRLFALLSLVSLAAFAACGSRTGLLVPGEGLGPGGGDDEGNPPHGSASDDATASDDGSVERSRDALPPLDVSVPHDAFDSCPDGGATLIYLVSESYELLSFYPPTAEFRTIGTLQCPATPTQDIPNPSPFSMAVDRTGIAYVVYSTGELFRVSTATASCEATGFKMDQHGFSSTFGMGFSQDASGTGETLFLAGADTATGTSPSLASLDTTNFALDVVAPISPAIDGSELTGTGAGDLFAFYATSGASPCDIFTVNPQGSCADSAIGQIDKTTGRVTNQAVLFGLQQAGANGGAWAFAFWGGVFYTFTAPGSETIVSRYNPGDGSVVTVATRADLIVGAGVSTCAPAE